MLNKFLFIFLLIPFSYGFSQNSFPLFSSGSYSGGSGDHTNVNNAQLKLQSLSGTYIRVPHVSSHSSVSTVFNFESAKSVYWGEPTDVGKYFFRGRDLVIENGKLGIGTTTGPNFNLDITTVGDFQGIQMYHNTGKWLRFFSSLPAGGFNGITRQNDAGIVFGQDGTLNHGFIVAPHQNLLSGIRIDREGNVGVGATTPDGFQVAIPLTSESSRGVTNVRMGVFGGTPRIFLDQAGSQSFEIDNAGGRFRIFNPGIERFSIDATTGNVAIGTFNTGSFKLAVEGKIGAREVNVTNASPWPDYVFKSDYKLPSLQQVKRFIETNGHLPEIPNAETVAKTGLDLGEMNALLLKKVEELTLYLLNQEEQIGEMKRKMLEQEKQIEKLIKRSTNAR